MDSDDEDRDDVEPLGNLARSSAVILGLALTGAGAVAVFVSENSVGTGVMLALGAFFLLIGVTGHAVASAKIGDAEVRFRRLARQVAASLDVAPSEVKTQLAEAILEAEPGSRDLLTARAASILIERDMIDAVDRMLRRDEALHGAAWAYAGPDDVGADGFISNPSGEPVSVILKALRDSVRADQVTGAIERLGPARRKVLFVSKSGFTVRARAYADLLNAEGSEVRLVQWRGREDDDDLYRALRVLLRNGAGEADAP